MRFSERGRRPSRAVSLPLPVRGAGTSAPFAGVLSGYSGKVLQGLEPEAAGAPGTRPVLDDLQPQPDAFRAPARGCGPAPSSSALCSDWTTGRPAPSGPPQSDGEQRAALDSRVLALTIDGVCLTI